MKHFYDFVSYSFILTLHCHFCPFRNGKKEGVFKTGKPRIKDAVAFFAYSFQKIKSL